MQLANFGLVIPEGRELHSQHVIMQHGQQYRIQVSNLSSRRCDAVVSLDGDEIGTYRLSAGQVWAIEHPSDSQKCFTFYASGTTEAAAVGEAVLDKDEKGLVQVTFYPEKISSLKDVIHTPFYDSGMKGGGAFGSFDEATRTGSKGLGAGVSGLSGHSAAQYGQTSSIERDEDNAVTITLRLVTEDTTPQPISARRRIANPVPPAV